MSTRWVKQGFSWEQAELDERKNVITKALGADKRSRIFPGRDP